MATRWPEAPASAAPAQPRTSRDSLVTRQSATAAALARVHDGAAPVRRRLTGPLRLLEQPPRQGQGEVELVHVRNAEPTQSTAIEGGSHGLGIQDPQTGDY